ncbi:hypothetical protein EW145_g598 [Phellinidium pouzarii]|uniref:DUF2423 domain-containing protein n=1 Tax=Phellinidium pouzarii TaxID=167371 RepID=A0A4S4LID7_9AGAM|nr:hypothetical protein EW145_g598 [Phellinidium pouzarii]
MRSKVKRSFRSKKREEGVYAAVEAARLQRISVKLKMVRDTDKEGDVELAEAEGMGTDAKIPGLSWFLLLGLVEPGSISVESMGCIQEAMEDCIVDALQEIMLIDCLSDNAEENPNIDPSNPGTCIYNPLLLNGARRHSSSSESERESLDTRAAGVAARGMAHVEGHGSAAEVARHESPGRDSSEAGSRPSASSAMIFISLSFPPDLHLPNPPIGIASISHTPRYIDAAGLDV